MTTASDQLIGCLVAGAAGDALGGPYDRLRADEIAGRLASSDLPPGARIGDDTQLVLWTMEGLMRAHVRWLARGLASPPIMVKAAYRRWAITQGVSEQADQTDDGWLLQQPEMHDRVNPAPRVLASATFQEPDEPDPSASGIGSGAIMRVAPVGLLSHGGAAVHLAEDVARLTHGGEPAIAASVAYAVIVNLLLDGAGLSDACARAVENCGHLASGEVLRPTLDKALGLAERRPREPDALHELGTGRTSLGALLHAVYATACTASVAEAVTTAVIQDGISSTSAALAGHLSSLVHGPDAVPRQWFSQLPVTHVIEQMVHDWQVIASSVSDDAGWSGYSGDGKTVPADVRERFPGR